MEGRCSYSRLVILRHGIITAARAEGRQQRVTQGPHTRAAHALRELKAITARIHILQEYIEVCNSFTYIVSTVLF